MQQHTEDIVTTIAADGATHRSRSLRGAGSRHSAQRISLHLDLRRCWAQFHVGSRWGPEVSKFWADTASDPGLSRGEGPSSGQVAWSGPKPLERRGPTDRQDHRLRRGHVTHRQPHRRYRLVGDSVGKVCLVFKNTLPIIIPSSLRTLCGASCIVRGNYIGSIAFDR